MNNKAEEKTMDYEEMAAQAEMEVAADKLAGGSPDAVSDSDTGMEQGEDDFIVEFTREYECMSGTDVKMIKSVDLSGLTELTCTDGEFLDRMLVQANHRPQNRFTDFTYCKYVAQKVTGLPLEFFNTLKIRDMMLIVGRINLFFLLG